MNIDKRLGLHGLTRIAVVALVPALGCLLVQRTFAFLFRGTASDQLSTKAENNSSKLDGAIDKIFEKLLQKSS